MASLNPEWSRLAAARVLRQGLLCASALASLLLAGGGCFDARYPCQSDDNCVHGGVGGFCRASASGLYCMFPDTSCDKKLRWDKSASSDVAGACVTPTCNDKVKNGVPGTGEETDVDCGGDCGGCGANQGCLKNTDCGSKRCVNGLCAAPTCSDGQQNGSESATDCGGGTCPPCLLLDRCTVKSDCVAPLDCIGSTCQRPGCNDGILNGTERNLDCGGPDCPPCLPEQACLVKEDCSTSLCDGASGKCKAITFDALTTVAGGKNPGMTVITDVDGDGKADLVVNSEGSASGVSDNGLMVGIQVNEVSVLIGKGDGSFDTTTYPPFATRTNSRTLVAADLDADTYPDFGFHSPFRGGWEAPPLMNDLVGSQKLTQWRIYDPAGGIDRRGLFFGDSFGAVAGFFNGDKAMDIALLVADFNSTSVDVITGNPNGVRNFGSETSYHIARDPPNIDPDPPIDARVVTADFDRDGDSDLAYASAVNGVTWLANDGAGHFTFVKNISAGINATSSLVAGDFNNDTWPDIACIATRSEFVADKQVNKFHSIFVLLNDPKQEFSTTFNGRGAVAGSRQVVPQYFDLAAADMNGDGKLDVVATSNVGGAQILYGDGKGSLVKGAELKTIFDGNLYYVSAGDLNGDGRPDVVASNWRTTKDVAVWLSPKP